MVAWARRIGWAVVLIGGLEACAISHGSNARPVVPAAEGAVLLSGGAIVNLGVAGGFSSSGNSAFAATTNKKFTLVPSAAFDYAFDDGYYFGIEASAFTPFSFGASSSEIDLFLLYVNPRFEMPLNDPDRTLSMTIDLNLAYLRVSGELKGSVPFMTPALGIRWYLPTGFGGPIFSQQISTIFVTLALPGSLAYDIPIPLGATSKLHIFPELRWDPTFFFTGEGSAFLIFFSGGLSFMFEI